MRLTRTHTRTFAHFILSGTLPTRLMVCDTSPPENKTRSYSVVADYGWAETILCSESYLPDANSIAEIIGEHLDIPVVLAEAATS
jgi:hypothetical protein